MNEEVSPWLWNLGMSELFVYLPSIFLMILHCTCSLSYIGRMGQVCISSHEEKHFFQDMTFLEDLDQLAAGSIKDAVNKLKVISAQLHS